jgi:hypothetical protein
MASVVNVGATGNAEIDGLLFGTKWNGPITYSFPGSPSDYAAGYGSGEPTAAGFAQTPAAMQQAVNYAFASVMSFTNLTISYAGTNGADIRVAQSSAANPTSYAYYPFNTANGEGGDVWFGTQYNYSAAALGNYYFATAIHELGHALGLKHSQETGGVANVAVPAAHDDLEFSVMSYRSYQGGPLTGYTNEAYGFPQSYMANDILALQTLYGANYNTHSENTVYTWSPSTGQEFVNGVAQLAPGNGAGGSANRIFTTIWDGNGIDTYDLSNYTTGVSINLNPGASSVTSAAQLAYLGNGHYAQGNIYNAYQVNGDQRSLIDNATGGSGNDVLIGNAIANVLNGGGGNDILIGGGGNDTIIGGSGTDVAVYSGNRANYLITYNAATQTFTVADQRSGTPDGTGTVIGVENFQFADGTIGSAIVTNHPPVVAVADIAGTFGQVIAASSLFSVTDTDGDAITEYQFWDGTPGAGHFIVNGVIQGVNQIIDVPAALLSQTSFQVGSGTDDLYVRAFDGKNWSVESGTWTMFHVSGPVNHAPVIVATDVNATAGQVIAASSLFSVTDADGDAITEYQFWDGTAGAGHFIVNGIIQGVNQIIDVPAAQLSQTSFQAGSGTDDLYVRAFDGKNWSVGSGTWTMFHITGPVNHAPVVAAADVSATAHQIIAASSLFSVTDADGDAITEYQFWDGTAGAGHFTVNGVIQGINQIIDVPAAQLSQTSFQTGSGTDDLYVRAFDGKNWSVESGTWTMFHVTGPANHAPVVVAADVSATAGQIVAAPSLFSVTDADGDTITEYQFWDGTPGAGHFTINGVIQGVNQIIDVLAARLSQTGFQAGAGTDDLYVRAFDATNWSVESGTWTMFHVTGTASGAGANHAPVVTTSDINAIAGQTIAASSLFSVTDADGDAITEYQFWDGTAGAGHFTVNGVTQAINQIIEVPAAQLAQTSFQVGSGTDDLYVRAFDGKNWSVESGTWTMFHVTGTASGAGANHTPVVATADVDADTDRLALWTTSSNGDSFHFHSLSQSNGPAHDEPFLEPASSNHPPQGWPEPPNSVGMLDTLGHADPVWWNHAHTDYLI